MNTNWTAEELTARIYDTLMQNNQHPRFPLVDVNRVILNSTLIGLAIYGPNNKLQFFKVTVEQVEPGDLWEPEL